MLKKIVLLTVLAAFVLGSGCVYYNTFYNAKKSFNEGEKRRKDAGHVSSKSKVGQSQYTKAIEKSQIVLDKYPSSKYYDDALYVNGVSHFWIRDYNKAEKRFRELIANFPESEYFRDARLYLAKSKLNLNEITDAMFLFEELFDSGEDKSIKAQAAAALGEYYVEEKEFDKAEIYFQAIVDSLGNNEEKNAARMYVADGLFSRFRYKPAYDAYAEILKHDVTLEEEYKAKYKAGECLYFLNDIEGGMEYYEDLAGNDLFYDSLPATKLMIAQGFDWDGELSLATEIYEEVAIESPRSVHGSYANYTLGLIYQFEFEDYRSAKDYYDQAKAAGKNSDVFDDALERSANIGKLEEYLEATQKEFDSTATLDEIDQAAETQYYLSELYLTKMDKPDSAFAEFQYLIDNFGQSYLAPKAMIALAVLNRDYYADTLLFDSLLDATLRQYPHSDYVKGALELRGLLGTPADTGYAEIYYKRAEHFVYDTLIYDSAYYYYSYVADSFPESELYVQANFARIWLTEEYQTPGDSSLYYAYLEFSDSFPNSNYTKEADKRLVTKKRQNNEFEEDYSEDSIYVDSAGNEYVIDKKQDPDSDDPIDRRVLTLEEKCSMGPDGENIWEVQTLPKVYEYEFRYPPSAYSLEFEGYLCFQIKIDPFGYVEEYLLITPTQSEDLNNEAIEAVKSAQFETYWIQPEYADSWFLLKYKIDLPASLR